MMKKLRNNKKGFTLAELLVVVAIIAILVAIAIPVFSAATQKAQAAVEVANARSCYAEGMSKQIAGDNSATTLTADGKVYTFAWDSADNTGKVTVAAATPDGKTPIKTVYTAAQFQESTVNEATTAPATDG